MAFTWSAAALVALAVAGCGLLDDDATSAVGSGDEAVEPNATTVRVVDGDTLIVEIDGAEERVRLIGMDTPESVAPNRAVECYGQEASERMEELVPPGTLLRLERDVEARDRYERLLAYVFRAEDGLHVNLDQVEQGYAVAMPYPPNTAMEDAFARAESDARARGAGLWDACGGPDVPIGPPPTSGD